MGVVVCDFGVAGVTGKFEESGSWRFPGWKFEVWNVRG